VRPDGSVKAVIWDCGGVIIRTEDDRSRREWERRLGLAHYELDRIVMASESWIQAQCGDITEDQYWSDIQHQLGLDERSLRSLRDDFYAGDRANAVVTDVIRRLRSHYKQAILSNAPLSLHADLRDRFQIAGLFHVIVASAVIGVMKPDPRAYEAALEGLSLRADETVFIDDLLPNIDAARRLGMHVIHFDSYDYDVRPELDALLGSPEP
jgi:putative hydrolase of the HAD superfamily